MTGIRGKRTNLLVYFLYTSKRFRKKEEKMVVLEWIFGILVVLFVAKELHDIDTYVMKRYHQRLFTKEGFVTLLIAYVFFFFGSQWYMTAVEKSGDILNGTILIAIGVALFIWHIYSNIQNTSIGIGILISVIQVVTYAVGGIFALISLFVAILFLAETKPVYVVNK